MVTCGWCDEPAVTDLIIVRGRKNRRTAPVCEAHAVSFERAGQMTVRLEVEQKAEKDLARKQWLKDHYRR